MDPTPPAESGVRIYRASGAGLVEVAWLDAIGPPRAAEGAIAPEVDGNHVGGAGLFLALVQGGRVVDLARLVFGGGAPSDADGDPDCYSSDPSSGEDRAPPSRSRAPPSRSRRDEKVSPNEFGSLSMRGGLVGLDEDWEFEGAGKGEDVDLATGEDDCWSNIRPVQSISTLWRLGNCDSSCDEEELYMEDDVSLKSEEWDLSKTKAGHSMSTFWKSGSTSDEEELQQELCQDLNEKLCHELHQDLDQELHHELNQNLQQELHQEVDRNHGNEEDNETSMQIILRLWPSQNHAVIKMFRGGKWALTKDFNLIWLKLEDLLEPTFKVDFGAPFADVLGFRNTVCIMDFEYTSPMLKDLLVMIKPSVRNFQILKKVGGQDPCQVFKCLFVGSKCALKALTQKDPLTSEPREIEIISNLKDTHVMMFYQAWIEPWAYKGPEQEYLFIHLEFCHSTLKHALLHKNRHWFPNKWHLFEKIVLSVGRLHKDHVVHRDLKPDNIFFNSEMRVLMGDFGDACIGRDEFGLYGGGTPKLGTEGYFAPELNTGGKITEKADIFSLGVILFEIFSMFQTNIERSFVFPNLRKEGPSDDWQGDRELYTMMTALEPNDRPSTAEVLDYIRQHHLEG